MPDISNVNQEQRNCIKCGSAYKPTSNRQKYCKQCSGRKESVCIKCGKAFLVTNSTGKYCSPQCWYHFVKSKRVEKKCLVCGKMFWSSASKQKTCSRECGTALTRRSPRKCPVCGLEFNNKHAYQSACSNECAGIARREKRNSNCKRCGRVMEFSENRHKMFCSEECRKTPIGARRETSSGYLLIMAGKGERGTNPAGWILEHRHVMEKKLGRQLLREETIHHINGKRDDNRIENLELRTGNHGKGIRVSDKAIDDILVQPEIVRLSEEIRVLVKQALSRVIGSAVDNK